MIAGLTSLIYVQTQWLKQALTVKREQFERTIDQTSEEVISELENSETYSVIVREINRNLHEEGATFQMVISRPGKKDSLELQITPGKDKVEIKKKILDQYEAEYSRDSVFTSEHSILFDPDDKSRTIENLRDYASAISQRTILVENILDKMIRTPPPIEQRINPVNLYYLIRTIHFFS